MRVTDHERILAALRNAGMRGLTAGHWAARGWGVKFSTRIVELKNLGWPIKDRWMKLASGKRCKCYWMARSARCAK